MVVSGFIIPRSLRRVFFGVLCGWTMTHSEVGGQTHTNSFSFSYVGRSLIPPFSTPELQIVPRRLTDTIISYGLPPSLSYLRRVKCHRPPPPPRAATAPHPPPTAARRTPHLPANLCSCNHGGHSETIFDSRVFARTLHPMLRLDRFSITVCPHCRSEEHGAKCTFSSSDAILGGCRRYG